MVVPALGRLDLLPQLAPVSALLLGFVGDAELIEAILEPRDQQAGGCLPIGHRFPGPVLE